MENALKIFQNYIINEKYFEAHEVLEELWHPMRKNNHRDKNIVRGIINAAVSLELKKRGRDNYIRVWKTYEKYKPQIEKNSIYYETMNFLDKYKPY